ncbi:MAG: hypothetical protein B7C24_05195 [Bacteroidetes bacterium 4572_77]|nr:MAG: hypothetical protein B7C24_05195 [Bacteroidetes bacterium 4572_77]
MKLSEFYKCFPNESTCFQILRCIREQVGILCKKKSLFRDYSKKYFSTLVSKKIFGHKSYESIWLMLKTMKNISKPDYLLNVISECIQLDRNEIRVMYNKLYNN